VHRQCLDVGFVVTGDVVVRIAIATAVGAAWNASPMFGQGGCQRGVHGEIAAATAADHGRHGVNDVVQSMVGVLSTTTTYYGT